LWHSSSLSISRLLCSYDLHIYGAQIFVSNYWLRAKSEQVVLYATEEK
jgi:hypothetical protein